MKEGGRNRGMEEAMDWSDEGRRGRKEYRAEGESLGEIEGGRRK